MFKYVRRLKCNVLIRKKNFKVQCYLSAIIKAECLNTSKHILYHKNYYLNPRRNARLKILVYNISLLDNVDD